MAELDELTQRVNARVGTLLKEKWRIDELLGIGGMAAVYAGTHRNKRRVAIKVLHPELSHDPRVRERFLREGIAANTVGHRGAVEVFDEDVADDGAAFLVMELLEGETLETRRTRKGGSLPAGEVLSLVDQLLGVLAAAHDKGIVHRDLKPENLFYTRDKVLKVLDFGIASVREAPLTAGGTTTRVGSVMGTPAFMAPEQARARWDLVDKQTDLWAVGATMFTLLTGRLVRAADTANEEIALAITVPVARLDTVMPGVAPEVAAFVDKALAYEKAERWPDALTMQTALREAYATHSARGSLPAVSVRGAGEEGAAPSNRAEAPAAAATVHASSTLGDAAGSTSVQPAQPYPGRGRLGVLAAVVAAAVLLVVIVAARGAGGGRPPEPASSPEPSAVPVVRPAEPSPVVTPQPATAAPTVVAVEAPAETARPAVKPALDKAAKRQAPPTTKKADPFSRRN